MVLKVLFVKISIRRRHVQMVGNGAFSNKIDYVTLFKDILNLKGHRITGSRVLVILLNGWSFSGGGPVINGAYPV